MTAIEVKNIKDKILKELDNIKEYIEWTSNLEYLEYFKGKQGAYENVLSWMKQ